MTIERVKDRKKEYVPLALSRLCHSVCTVEGAGPDILACDLGSTAARERDPPSGLGSIVWTEVKHPLRM